MSWKANMHIGQFMWLAAGTGCWYQASVLYHTGFSTKLIEYLHNMMAGFPQSECDERGGGYILFMAQSQQSHNINSIH